MNIQDLQRIHERCGLAITVHGSRRMRERGISREEVEYAIEHGKIIHEYPDTKPLPKYLVLCFVYHNVPLHVVFAASEKHLALVTAYRPDPAKWNETFTAKKEGSE